MPFNVSSLAKAKELYERADKRIKKIGEDHSKSIGEALRVGVTCASTAAMGLANGRFGGDKQEIEVMGIPVDLTLGVLVQGVSYTKIVPEGHKILTHSVGTGLLAAATYRAMHKVGRSMLEEKEHHAAQPAPQQLAAGSPPWGQSPPWNAAAPANMAVPQGAAQTPRG